MLFAHKVIGEEDCLILNVYVPGDAGKSRGKDELLPVMFWIHGGAYFTGSGNSDMYGPERFMDYGVVRKYFHLDSAKSFFLNVIIPSPAYDQIT